MKRYLIAVLVFCAVAIAFAALQELGVEEAVICKAVVDRTPEDPGQTFPASSTPSSWSAANAIATAQKTRTAMR